MAGRRRGGQDVALSEFKEARRTVSARCHVCAACFTPSPPLLFSFTRSPRSLTGHSFLLSTPAKQKVKHLNWTLRDSVGDGRRVFLLPYSAWRCGQSGLIFREHPICQATCTYRECFVFINHPDPALLLIYMNSISSHYMQHDYNRRHWQKEACLWYFSSLMYNALRQMKPSVKTPTVLTHTLVLHFCHSKRGKNDVPLS